MLVVLQDNFSHEALPAIFQNIDELFSAIKQTQLYICFAVKNELAVEKSLMKYKLIRYFFWLMLIVGIALSFGSMGYKMNQMDFLHEVKTSLHHSLIKLDVLPAVMRGTPERRRLLALNRQKNNEFFLGLSGNDLAYEEYLKLAQSLWQIPGVYWYTGEPNVKNNLTNFVREQTYYLGRASGLEHFAKNLESYLGHEINKLKSAGVNIEQVLQNDPLLLRYHNGNDSGYLNNDGLFVIADGQNVCQATSCFMLHGILMSGTDGRDFREAAQNIASNFIQKGGHLTISGGLSVATSVAQGIYKDIMWLLLSGLLVSFFVLWVMFKSLRVFGVLALSMLIASFTGFAAVCGYYGSFHLITLIVAAPIWPLMLIFYMNFMLSRLAINSRRPHYGSIILSFIVATSAYGLLALSARSLLAESALFAVTSLATFTAILFGPGANTDCPPLKTHRVFRFVTLILNTKWARFIAGTAFLILVWVSAQNLLGIFSYVEHDSFGGVQGSRVGLDQKTLRMSLSSDSEYKRFTVSGDTKQEVAQEVQKVEKYLKRLQQKGLVKNIITYSGMLVTDDEAQYNLNFYEKLLPRAEDFYKAQGVVFATPLTIKAPELKPLAFFTAGGYGRYARQVLDMSVTPAVSIVTVSGLSADDEIKFLEKFPSCSNTDMVAELGIALNQFAQELVSVLAIFIIGSICLIFMLRGFVGVLYLAWPAVIGTGGALIAIKIFGLSFSLFTVVALVLVHSLGLVSAIFLQKVRFICEERLILSLSVAFVISIASYSTMVCSKLHGISDMGVVLLSGVFCATFSALFVDIVLARKLKSSRFARLATFKKRNNSKTNKNLD